jgi:hypothetical protein
MRFKVKSIEIGQGLVRNMIFILRIKTQILMQCILTSACNNKIYIFAFTFTLTTTQIAKKGFL